jgi:hypothetical protein
MKQGIRLFIYVFVIYLPTLRIYNVRGGMINEKYSIKYAKKSNLSYSPGICLQKLTKTTINHDTQCPNLRTCGVLPPRHS